ncbi:MAG: sulfurtransferase complex subunit TusC [Anaerolineae bacterium]
MSNRISVLMRKAPYGSVYTAEGLRSMMGIAVFGADIDVIFIDDGVYALIKGQNPTKLDMKPLGDGFPGLSEFGINRFWVHDESLAERGLNQADLVLDVQVVSSAQIADILAQANKVLPF